MENNKNKKSVKFQGDVLNFCDFIQVFVFTRNHHLKVIILFFLVVLEYPMLHTKLKGHRSIGSKDICVGKF